MFHSSQHVFSRSVFQPHHIGLWSTQNLWRPAVGAQFGVILKQDFGHRIFRWHGFHWNYGNPKIHTKIHAISASWSMFPIEMAICGQYFQTNPHVHRFPQPQTRTCEEPDPELRHDQVMDKELPMRESWNLKRSHWIAEWYMNDICINHKSRITPQIADLRSLGW
jgi:hypothetical protein